MQCCNVITEEIVNFLNNCRFTKKNQKRIMGSIYKRMPEVIPKTKQAWKMLKNIAGSKRKRYKFSRENLKSCRNFQSNCRKNSYGNYDKISKGVGQVNSQT